MLIRIDPTRDEPVFAQLAASIRADVAAGRLSAGDRLPAAREVASSLGVELDGSIADCRVGIARDEGLVDMRRGRGAVLTDRAVALADVHHDVEALVARARALGVARESLVAMIRDTSPPISDDEESS